MRDKNIKTMVYLVLGLAFLSVCSYFIYNMTYVEPVKYDTTIELMVGFLDGIDDSLKESNNLDEVTEDSEVTIDIDTEKLYMNMVQCNAQWLYTLPQWDAIYTKEKREELYKKEKSSHTIVKPPKVGRNDPCPCGSGKKYKKCCGANL